MCEKAPLLRSKCLQKIFKLVKETGSWDSVNWNEYPTVPVNDRDKMGLVQIRNSLQLRGSGILNHLLNEQKTGGKQQIPNLTYNGDTIVHCEGGFIPCHRIILMHHSELLENLINENIKHIGVPSEQNPVHIHLLDFKRNDVERALLLFYSGVSFFPQSSYRAVNSILEFLKVKDPDSKITHEPNYLPKPEDAKKNSKLALMQYVQMTDESSDSEHEDKKETKPPNLSPQPTIRTGEWVDQAMAEIEELRSSEDTESNVSTKTTKISSNHNSVRSVATPSSSNAPSVSSSRKRVGAAIQGPLPKATGKMKLKKPAFQKVTPGSLINKQPQPRIQRKQLQPVGKKNKKSTTPKKPVSFTMTTKPLEPLASTSRSESSKMPYEHDGEYQPSDLEDRAPSTDKEDFDEDEDSDGLPDGDQYHLIERQLRTRTIKPIKPVETEGMSLAERLKLNPRKRSQSGEDKNPNRSSEPPLQAPERRSNSSNVGSVNKTGDSQNGTSSEQKCYFCNKEFSTEKTLIEHSKEECGKHLKDQYSLITKECLICNQPFLDLSHYEFVGHVSTCYLERGRISQTESDTEAVVDEDEPDRNSTDFFDSASNELPGDDTQMASSKEINANLTIKEKLKLITTQSVILEKFSPTLIRDIIFQIQNGGKVDIPRVKGYKYVKVAPKNEIPDFYPEDSEEMTNERIRQLEQEQKESMLESERRHQLKKKQQQEAKAQEAKTRETNAVRTVPPLVLDRCRLIKKSDVILNAQDIFEGFTKCSCDKKHVNVKQALLCMGKRDLQKCWVCCQELALDHPPENHYRNLHSAEHYPGQITCPVCKCLLIFKEINDHIFRTHFENWPRFINEQSPVDSPPHISQLDLQPVGEPTDQQTVAKKRGRPCKTKPGPKSKMLENSKRMKNSIEKLTSTKTPEQAPSLPLTSLTQRNKKSHKSSKQPIKIKNLALAIQEIRKSQQSSNKLPNVYCCNPTTISDLQISSVNQTFSVSPSSISENINKSVSPTIPSESSVALPIPISVNQQISQTVRPPISTQSESVLTSVNQPISQTSRAAISTQSESVLTSVNQKISQTVRPPISTQSESVLTSVNQQITQIVRPAISTRSNVNIFAPTSINQCASTTTSQNMQEKLAPIPSVSLAPSLMMTGNGISCDLLFDVGNDFPPNASRTPTVNHNTNSSASQFFRESIATLNRSVNIISISGSNSNSIQEPIFSCQKCSRLFKSSHLYETHFCLV